MKKLLLLCGIFVFQIPFAQQSPTVHRPTATPITSTIKVTGHDETQGHYGQGEYEIFLDNVDGVFDKPVILVDGFDPGDSRSITDIYASLEYGGQNMADLLRNDGFDIVILNFPLYNSGGTIIDGGSDYLLRNATTLIALIEEVNTTKVGANELVVIGPSSGGLIARLALAYFEKNNIDHQTRLYISFDAPHRGANIPISFQYATNYFAQEIGDPSIQVLVDKLLNSPAAKEMLVDHHTAHYLPGSPFDQDPAKLKPSPSGFRTDFIQLLDSIGFPTQLRSVAVVNGSGIGTTLSAPGIDIVNTTLTLDASTTADIKLKFTPAAGLINTVTDVKVKLYGIPISSYVTQSQSLTTSDGVDNAPGSTRKISEDLGNGAGNPIFQAFIAALQQDEYSFVPTLSALDIDEPSWHAVPDLTDSPFDAVHIDNKNDGHLTMTNGNFQFIMYEITGRAVGIEDFQKDFVFTLNQNPVKAAIEIGVPSNISIGKLTASVYSLTGQKLMENEWRNPQNTLRWNHELTTGLYLLKLENGRSSQTIKMLVE